MNVGKTLICMCRIMSQQGLGSVGKVRSLRLTSLDLIPAASGLLCEGFKGNIGSSLSGYLGGPCGSCPSYGLYKLGWHNTTIKAPIFV